MTIAEIINTALSAVLSNTWSEELPPEPVWPAIVFNIESTPEQQWVQGGGYDQHSVGVVIYAKLKTEIKLLKPLVLAALEAIPGYMLDGDFGDANYEDDASVYGFYSNHVIRLRRSDG